ncbi:MAG: ribonuclease P protein component [Bacteroidota bacterium]
MYVCKNKPVKKHQLSKHERLSNFSFKSHLFRQGNVLFSHPIKIFWTTIDPCVENFFFSNNVQLFYAGFAPSETTHYLRIQNPSFPFKKIPSNASFYFPAKILFGASSKIHSSACKRNKIKRLMKEAFRQNKHDFYPFLNQQNVFLIAAFIYTGKQVVSYTEIEKKIIVSLHKIRKQIANKPI